LLQHYIGGARILSVGRNAEGLRSESLSKRDTRTYTAAKFILSAREHSTAGLGSSKGSTVAAELERQRKGLKKQLAADQNLKVNDALEQEAFVETDSQSVGGV